MMSQKTEVYYRMKIMIMIHIHINMKFNLEEDAVQAVQELVVIECQIEWF